MDTKEKREVWQKGPVENIPELLQPVAHALLQAHEEINNIMLDFPMSKLWMKPAGVASVGFHLQHLTGVLDRLFTYARCEVLTAEQVDALSKEGKFSEVNSDPEHLVQLFNQQVDKALDQLSNTDEKTLTDNGSVGRARIPSTVIGLFVHSAEHTMRHVGQLYVTVKVVKAGLQL